MSDETIVVIVETVGILAIVMALIFAAERLRAYAEMRCRMRLEKVLQMIAELIIYHKLFTNAETEDYHKGAVDALKDLRDAIKQQKGGEEWRE